MAKSLLNCVNEILKRSGLIAGDSGLLTTLTDSARQPAIDQAIQVVNEGLEELYSQSNIALPNEQAESSITLVAGTRAYALHANLVQLRWPFIDRTNNQYLYEYPGGYNALIIADPEQDDTGQPFYAAIRPTDGYIFLDRTPTSTENGKVYYYQYDKNLALSVAADTVPFSDPVFRAMVPAWQQLWKREFRNEFDGEIYAVSVGRAARLMTQKQARSSWSPR